MHVRTLQVGVLVSVLVLVPGSAVGASNESDPTPLGTDFRISTAVASEFDPAVTWNATANEYLVVWKDQRTYGVMRGEIFGRRVGADGIAVGPDFRVSTSPADERFPAVVWNATANEYLVVWQDERNFATRGWEVYGRRLEADGDPAGPDFLISSSVREESAPAVVWNGATNQYLVVWQDSRSVVPDAATTRGFEIYGRRVGANGNPLGTDFLISDSRANEYNPQVTWNAITNKYFVVWVDNRNHATRGWEVYGRRVGPYGSPVGSEYLISTSTSDELAPTVVWNETANQYLVVWHDGRSVGTRGFDIYGRRLRSDGVPVGVDFRISNSAADEYSPAVVWNETANQYLVVWEDERNFATRLWEIFGRRVGADGVLVGVDFRVSASTSLEYRPAVVWNATANQYLVVWQDERKFLTRGTEIYGRRITGDSPPCPPSGCS